MRNVTIVGGAGYIGSVLSGFLLGQGYNVTVLDNFIYGHNHCVLSHLSKPGYAFRYGDFCDASAVESALESATDVVILAGLVGDPITKKYPEASAAINGDGVIGLIDQLNGRGLNRVIFVSTCSNYGLIEDGELADEEFELNPLSLYAKSKVEAEKHLLDLKGEVDYEPTVLRFATAFGLSSRMRFDLTVSEFVRDLAMGKELLVFDAKTWRPYCHVQDFARLIDCVLGADAADVSFEVFNAGGDVNNYTKQGIVDLILQKLPDAKVKYQEKGSDPRNYRVDFSKVRERLGFEPKYTVEDGIVELLDAMRNNVFENVDKARNLYGNYELDYPV